MVEDRKTKGSVAVTSSEKADSYGRYFKVRQLPAVGLFASLSDTMALSMTTTSSATLHNPQDFHIATTPYPGCEFFRQFRANAHCGTMQSYIRAHRRESPPLIMDRDVLVLLQQQQQQPRRFVSTGTNHNEVTLSSPSFLRPGLTHGPTRWHSRHNSHRISNSCNRHRRQQPCLPLPRPRPRPPPVDGRPSRSSPSLFWVRPCLPIRWLHLIALPALRQPSTIESSTASPFRSSSFVIGICVRAGGQRTPSDTSSRIR